MIRAAKTVLLATFVFTFISLASTEARAMTVYFNDGKIEYVDYQPDAIHIKLTRAGLDYGTSYVQAWDLAKRVQSHRPSAFRAWPAISNSRLALQIQLHAGWYTSYIPFYRSHANPIDVTWREIT